LAGAIAAAVTATRMPSPTGRSASSSSPATRAAASCCSRASVCAGGGFARMRLLLVLIADQPDTRHMRPCQTLFRAKLGSTLGAPGWHDHLDVTFDTSQYCHLRFASSFWHVAHAERAIEITLFATMPRRSRGGSIRRAPRR